MLGVVLGCSDRGGGWRCLQQDLCCRWKTLGGERQLGRMRGGGGGGGRGGIGSFHPMPPLTRARRIKSFARFYSGTVLTGPKRCPSRTPGSKGLGLADISINSTLPSYLSLPMLLYPRSQTPRKSCFHLGVAVGTWEVLNVNMAKPIGAIGRTTPPTIR